MMDDTNKQLSEFLHLAIIKESVKAGRTISQSELARRCGVPQGSLNQYINGTRLPDDKNKHKLAGYLGVEIYEILGGPVMLPDNEYMRRVARVLPKLTPDQQKSFTLRIEEAAQDWEEQFNQIGK